MSVKWSVTGSPTRPELSTMPEYAVSRPAWIRARSWDAVIETSCVGSARTESGASASRLPTSAGDNTSDSRCRAPSWVPALTKTTVAASMPTWLTQ